MNKQAFNFKMILKCMQSNANQLPLHRRESIMTEVDFEVTDALGKLKRMGILSEDAEDDKGNRLLRVLPLDLALEAAHINKFDESRYMRVMLMGCC